jgi:hypothetical protein
VLGRKVVIIVCNYKVKSNYNRLIKQFRVVSIIPPMVSYISMIERRVSTKLLQNTNLA